MRKKVLTNIEEKKLNAYDKERLISSGNEDDYDKLDNTANIEEDFFDSKSFNFSQNYNFADNKEKNLFMNDNQDNGPSNNIQKDLVIELNKYNLPIKGFAVIIEKQLFCMIILMLDNDVTDSNNEPFHKF